MSCGPGSTRPCTARRATSTEPWPLPPLRRDRRAGDRGRVPVRSPGRRRAAGAPAGVRPRGHVPGGRERLREVDARGAIAGAAGFNPEGGSRSFDFATRPSESSLGVALRIGRAPGRERSSFFLRAESYYNVATEIENLRLDRVDAYGGVSPTNARTASRSWTCSSTASAPRPLPDGRARGRALDPGLPRGADAYARPRAAGLPAPRRHPLTDPAGGAGRADPGDRRRRPSPHGPLRRRPARAQHSPVPGGPRTHPARPARAGADATRVSGPPRRSDGTGTTSRRPAPAGTPRAAGARAGR
ncbi:MAG: hypothetical protein QOJ30_3405 [Pseudonocardiales bacterium]|nr:hypothetical protein [Pseudonocardiales bacterium]